MIEILNESGKVVTTLQRDKLEKYPTGKSLLETFKVKKRSKITGYSDDIISAVIAAINLGVLTLDSLEAVALFQQLTGMLTRNFFSIPPIAKWINMEEYEAKYQEVFYREEEFRTDFDKYKDDAYFRLIQLGKEWTPVPTGGRNWFKVEEEFEEKNKGKPFNLREYPERNFHLLGNFHLGPAKWKPSPVKNELDVILRAAGSDGDKVFIAGGSVLSALYKIRSSDYDIFIVSSNPKEAEKIILTMINQMAYERLKKTKINSFTVMRSSGAITVKYPGNKWKDVKGLTLQFILRLYQTPSEIIHGFDVDCCAILYNNKGEFWCTERCMMALNYSVNHYNFGRRSPSYNYRLIKYFRRHFNIWIPDFDRGNINTKKTMIAIENWGNLELMMKRDNLDQLILGIQKRKSRKGQEKSLLGEKVGEFDYEQGKQLGSKDKLIVGTENEYLSISGIRNSRVAYAYGVEVRGRLVESVWDKILDIKNYNQLKKSRVTDYIGDQEYTVIEFNVPQRVEFKTINPGEQLTGTFNPINMTKKDIATWYSSSGLYDHPAT